MVDGVIRYAFNIVKKKQFYRKKEDFSNGIIIDCLKSDATN